MTDTTYLSKEKHEELVAELEELRTARRQEIAEQLERAKAFGDLSENAEYHEAREDQAKVEARIYELEAMLKNVSIISHKKSDSVEVGSVVTLRKAGEEGTVTYEIVGSEEADMRSGKISLNAPLGQAMFGKHVKETFVFTAPSGKKTEYTIIRIE